MASAIGEYKMQVDSATTSSKISPPNELSWNGIPVPFAPIIMFGGLTEAPSSLVKLWVSLKEPFIDATGQSYPAMQLTLFYNQDYYAQETTTTACNPLQLCRTKLRLARWQSVVSSETFTFIYDQKQNVSAPTRAPLWVHSTKWCESPFSSEQAPHTSGIIPLSQFELLNGRPVIYTRMRNLGFNPRPDDVVTYTPVEEFNVLRGTWQDALSMLQDEDKGPLTNALNRINEFWLKV
jgi:hypothetical protein